MNWIFLQNIVYPWKDKRLSFSYLSTVMFRGTLYSRWRCPIYISTLQTLCLFLSVSPLLFFTRNAQVTLPQMKINSLKKQNDFYLFHTFQHFQKKFCKSGIAIFVWRVAWNYANSSFKALGFEMILIVSIDLRKFSLVICSEICFQRNKHRIFTIMCLYFLFFIVFQSNICRTTFKI